jgi:hypothetical protein
MEAHDPRPGMGRRLAVLSQIRLQSVLSKPHAPRQIQGLEHVYSLPGSALQTLNALDPSSCLSTPSNLSSHSFGLARLTSYPGTSLSELLFKRDVPPQVSFAGLIREPKYGHLAALHSALRACEPALLAVDEPLQLQLGPQQEVRGTGPSSPLSISELFACRGADSTHGEDIGLVTHMLEARPESKHAPEVPKLLVKEVG